VNEPVVSLETLTKLEGMEMDRIMERVMRRHGFTEADLTYEEIDGERRLLINSRALDYIMAHKKAMRREFKGAKRAASIKALESGLAIIELQKTGGRYE
jgi:hypothetical protein